MRESSGSYLINASANVRELNRAHDWELPTDGPKTLNGLIVERLEDIPEPSTCLKISGYPIEIVSVEDNRIETIRIRPADRVVDDIEEEEV